MACWVVIVHGDVPLVQAVTHSMPAVHLRFLWGAWEAIVTARRPRLRQGSRYGRPNRNPLNSREGSIWQRVALALRDVVITRHPSPSYWERVVRTASAAPYSPSLGIRPGSGGGMTIAAPFPREYTSIGGTLNGSFGQVRGAFARHLRAETSPLGGNFRGARLESRHGSAVV